MSPSSIHRVSVVLPLTLCAECAHNIKVPFRLRRWARPRYGKSEVERRQGERERERAENNLLRHHPFLLPFLIHIVVFVVRPHMAWFHYNYYYRDDDNVENKAAKWA